MMDFGVIENEIVAWLVSKNLNQLITIEVIGQNDSDYELPFGKTKIIVAFSNEEPDPISNSFDIVYQSSSVMFSILLQSRTIRGNNGVYALGNFVKKHLTGYQPTDGEPFKYAGMRFEQKVKNVFEYSLDFRTKAVVIQDVQEETGPPFKGLTIL
nr:Gp37 family protein [Pedobacter sp. ASV19]